MTLRVHGTLRGPGRSAGAGGSDGTVRVLDGAAAARVREIAAEARPPSDGGRAAARRERVGSGFVAARETLRGGGDGSGSTGGVAGPIARTVDYLRRAAPRGRWSSPAELLGPLQEAEALAGVLLPCVRAGAGGAL